MRTWLSWSSGKDSAWALHILRSHPDVEVVGLLTTVNERFGRVAMHAVRRSILEAQAGAVGLPLHMVDLPFPCSSSDYDLRMAEAVGVALEQGVEAIAFGDLFLEDVRKYLEQRLEGTGLRPLFPLWGTPTAELAREMIDAGLRATVTCVDPRRMSPSFAGLPFDHQLLADLPRDVDPCGENGEFHTLVTAGPMLRVPLETIPGEVVTRDGFVFADLRPDSAPRQAP